MLLLKLQFVTVPELLKQIAPPSPLTLAFLMVRFLNVTPEPTTLNARIVDPAISIIAPLPSITLLSPVMSIVELEQS